jgi:transposase-like protein
VTSRTSKKTAKPATAQEQLAAAMVAWAQGAEAGVDRPDGLLKQLTMTVPEAALGADMTEHLGHAEHADQPGRNGTNVRSVRSPA